MSANSKTTGSDTGGQSAPDPNEAKSSKDMTDTTTIDEGAGKVTEAAGDAAATPLAPELQGHIGKHLRTIYGDLVKEPVPDRFKILLDNLAARESSEKRESEEKQQ